MAHNIHEYFKKTLGDILTAVLNQIRDEGDGSNMGVVKVVKQGVLMLHEIMRVTIKHINVLGG